jgi:carbamoyl-phosphate synthase large subunit
VLITGCGGAIGQGAVEALRKGSGRLRLIGVDSDPYAAFFYLNRKSHSVDKTYAVPNGDHADFIPEIINICLKEKVDVIFPSTDSELEKLSVSRDKIAELGTKTIISPPETIKICRDKWSTYRSLNEHLPLIKSALPTIGIEKALQLTGLPAIIKPRHKWGSRQVYKVNSVNEAKSVICSVDEPIIQSWLEGEEYTVDGLADKYGKAMCLVPRRRIKIFSGLSFQGMTVRDEELIKIGQQITEHLKIMGPFNFQAKKIGGEAKIFEINPRFAGSGILSVEAGVNIPVLAVKEICNMNIPKNIDFREGVVLSRYFDEVFFNIKGAKTREN